MDLNCVTLKPNPFTKANPISKLLFIWVFPFLWKGLKKDLTIEDMYSSLPNDSSEKLGNFVEKEWEKEVKFAAEKTANEQESQPNLWKIIKKLIWKRYTLVGIGYVIDELGIRVAQPIILRNFIKLFSENEKDYPNLRRDQYLYAVALITITGVYAIFFQLMITVTIHLGMRVRLGISSLIYRKILRLRKGDSENTNVGKLCNMLASDVSRFDQGFFLLHFFYICPLQVILYCYLLWKEIGWTCMGGIGCILFLLPFQILVGRFFVYFRYRIAKRTDERGRFLNEIISGIRLIKMYAWEKPFGFVISNLRISEIKYIRRALYLRGTFVSVHFIAQKLIPFCVLILYVAVGNTLTADKAFYVIAIFGILQTLMNRIPNAASQLGEMIASAIRIEALMGAKESNSANIKNCQNEKSASINNLKDVETIEQSNIIDDEPSIYFHDFTASWTREQETLKNLNINIKGNKLVMVVGHVGSGKTSLLHAILSELSIVSSGSCSVNGIVSYASQEGWIFPGTVRQNILFGLDMDWERYWSTIKFCCLEDDLDGFPDADLTFVGERGVALSGGQKARVNLARAIYHQPADIYLLDDPLSAVDGKVGRLLLVDCIKGLLKDKMRILVTHQLQYLPLADYVIVLNREGGLWFQGTFEDLRRSELDFSSLISDKHLGNSIDIDELLDKQNDEEPAGEKSNSGEDDGNAINENHKTQTSKSPVNNLTKNAVAESNVRRLKDEEKQTGSVGFTIYFKYLKSGGSFIMMFLILLGFVSCQVCFNLLDYWLGLWTNSAVGTVAENGNKTVVENTTRSDLNLQSIWSDLAEKGDISEQAFFSYVYCGIMGIFILVTVIRSILFFRYCMKISINLHDSMFASLVRAPVKFFDDNPSGRIMNRYTKDLNNIDELLPISFYDFIAILLTLLGMLVLNIVANYYIAVPAALLLVGLWRLRHVYLATARDLKRIEALSNLKTV